MLTSACATCRKDKMNYSDAECVECLTARASLDKEFGEQFPDASISDRLYAVRQAMTERQAHSRSNYRDPRDFTRNP